MVVRLLLICLFVSFVLFLFCLNSLNQSTFNRFELINASQLIFFYRLRIVKCRMCNSSRCTTFYLIRFDNLYCCLFPFFPFCWICRGILLINANSLKWILILAIFFFLVKHRKLKKKIMTKIKIQPLTIIFENVCF